MCSICGAFLACPEIAASTGSPFPTGSSCVATGARGAARSTGTTRSSSSRRARASSRPTARSQVVDSDGCPSSRRSSRPPSGRGATCSSSSSAWRWTTRSSRSSPSWSRPSSSSGATAPRPLRSWRLRALLRVRHRPQRRARGTGRIRLARACAGEVALSGAAGAARGGSAESDDLLFTQALGAKRRSDATS